MLALILSSYVAASRIGGGAQLQALSVLGVEPVLVPTVMLGASPAGGGRGGPVAPELFGMLLHGVEAQGVLAEVDLILTGYFALADQVAMAAETIAKARAVSRLKSGPTVVVDPVLGDAPKGLYVKPEVADALARRLVPEADWITPNLWELSYLSGIEAQSVSGAFEAAWRLGKPALVTSAPAGEGEVGLLCCEPSRTTLIAHSRRENVPNGTGDLVSAVFGAGVAAGLAGREAAERAAQAVTEVLSAEESFPLGLPLVRLGDRLASPSVRLQVEKISLP